MRTSILGMVLASALIAAPVYGDDEKKAKRTATTAAESGQEKAADAAAGTRNAAADARDRVGGKDTGDVTYGRIKELTPGQKVVVDVDNNIDKSFDLTDQDTKVTVAKTLKVGDPVKITEVDQGGRKMVKIARHAGKNVKHGDQSAAETKADQRERVRTDEDKDIAAAGKADRGDVTYGRIKELTPGQKVVVDVDDNIDKSFDLTDQETKVTLAKTLKVGDPVKITEVDQGGQKMVKIARHAGKNVKHGDQSAAETKADQRERVRTDEDKDVKAADKTPKRDR